MKGGGRERERECVGQADTTTTSARYSCNASSQEVGFFGEIPPLSTNDAFKQHW